MVLLHLQTELWPWHRGIYHNDVDICWIQFRIQSTAHRVDGCGLYVCLLWTILWCVGSRFK